MQASGGLLFLAEEHVLPHVQTCRPSGDQDIIASVLYHPEILQAKESFAKLQPPEVRILKHLLQEESPTVRLELLGNAFTPGPELETVNQDFLTTCAPLSP